MLIIIVIVTLVGVKIANRIVSPIKRLTDLAVHLSTENVQESAKIIIDRFDQDLLEGDTEISNLSNAFKNLVIKVQEEQITLEKDKEIHEGEYKLYCPECKNNLPLSYEKRITQESEIYCEFCGFTLRKEHLSNMRST
jgi:nitrogen fixation/metabolism regulation signal transduction histidine kinase